MKSANKSRPLLGDMLFTSLASLMAGMVTSLCLGLLVYLLTPLVQAGEAFAPSPLRPDQVQRGSLLLRLADGAVTTGAPLLETDVQVDINGFTARVHVRQQFSNPGSVWAEGVYVFPLPENAAVDRLRLRIGERVIEGEVRERQEAKRRYEAARKSGRKATLLSQERPNIFTTSVANIGPGERVQVEIVYQQTLAYEQGRFSLRFPLVVAPRYIPGSPVAAREPLSFDGSGWARNTDQVPDADRVTPPVIDPGQGTINPVSIRVRLDAGLPLARLQSLYHPVSASQDALGIHHLDLNPGSVPADRDFVLEWVPKAAAEPRAALFSEQWQGAQYALLMVMPPAPEDQPAPPPREVIFVVDRSGSMLGESMSQARAALRLALQRLRPADRFNVIRFNHSADALFARAMPASPGNLARAGRYVDRLQADGGTEMLPALQIALGQETEAGVLRQIVFLTDGSVGNEKALLELIHQRLGQSRLFTVGIGSAPNSHFMTRAAAFGRGSFTYIGKVDEVGERMQTLLGKLEEPLLTDIQIDWPEGVPVEMWPQRLPDLYQGEPLLLTLKTDRMPPSVRVGGVLGGHSWNEHIPLRGGGRQSGIHLLWARRKIAALMDQGIEGRASADLRAEIVDVALEHRLVSRYTSLVAVDRTPARPVGERLRRSALPVNLPRGWQAEGVFGRLPQTATASELRILSGLLLLLMGVLGYRRLCKGEVGSVS
ncbi:MAG: marine proteobacterial sortase target protein [Sedimenticola sp.]|nr:marine proteobacterial sortase target protein [Sedimenticola sp.]